MDIFAVAGFAVIAAIFAVLLRRYQPEIAVVIGLGAGILILIYVIIQAQPAVNEVSTLLDEANIDSSYAVILLKSLGICFITQLAADACNDAGESSIGSKIELAGKFAVLLVALPLFKKVAELAISLMH